MVRLMAAAQVRRSAGHGPPCATAARRTRVQGREPHRRAAGRRVRPAMAIHQPVCLSTSRPRRPARRRHEHAPPPMGDRRPAEPPSGSRPARLARETSAPGVAESTVSRDGGRLATSPVPPASLGSASPRPSSEPGGDRRRHVGTAARRSSPPWRYAGSPKRPWRSSGGCGFVRSRWGLAVATFRLKPDPATLDQAPGADVDATGRLRSFRPGPVRGVGAALVGDRVSSERAGPKPERGASPPCLATPRLVVGDHPLPDDG